MNNLTTNTDILKREFEWLAEFIQLRFTTYFQPGTVEDNVYNLPPTELTENWPYAKLIAEMNAHPAEDDPRMPTARRLLVLLALAPHLHPAILDVFFTKNKLYDRRYTEFGGATNQHHPGFLPTGETAMFLLAGDDLELRIRLQSLFHEADSLVTGKVVSLRGQLPNAPFLSGVLTISNETVARLTTGESIAPRDDNFPARLLKTPLGWDDLILDSRLKEELEEMSTWISHQTKIMGDLGLGRHLKPGYRALFYGPSGTGKTLSAALLGQRAKRPVYRIDLSQFSAAYIGETEKNLADLFARAERNNWILFFDEADALFGKRTTVKGSNGRQAGQEITYLLQGIESYDGVVILSTNMEDGIDQAFARRFQNMLYFPVPNAEQRRLLWENIFGDQLPLADDVDFGEIAQGYEMTGGNMANVLRSCALAAVKRDPILVTGRDIAGAIKRELRRDKT